MSFSLNEKIRKLTPYDPIAGDYPIRLDANESFLPIGAAERAALVRAAEEANLRRYPDPAAQRLCQAAAAYYDCDPAQLVAWNGTDEALLLLSGAFLGRGTALLCYAQDFSMYHFYAYLSGADCIKLSKREDFSIDPDAAVAALREYRPALFLFSNPCNPTSLILPKDDVRRLVRAAEDPGTLVALDEAYMDFADASLLDEVADYDNLVILRTCSKAPGLAGLRLGFSVANETLTQTLRAVKSPYNVGALTQAVGEAMFRDPARLRTGIADIRRSKDALAAGLRRLADQMPARLRVIGSEANFVFLTLPDTPAAFEFLKRRGIIVRAFYGSALRITAGTDAENAAVLSYLEQYLTETVL
ncbi:MAG: aminotransferase class I/II-fold pyridoxal phosphate-dependent enzyme [Oscillospiraceae bacterium]|jgi:histidinol-phosphate aminotransferase|nr:aminotransferase class I/II-fold pyridoxal phosphate-dependent enzyme [Oscillospiraceae bacterium]